MNERKDKISRSVRTYFICTGSSWTYYFDVNLKKLTFEKISPLTKILNKLKGKDFFPETTIVGGREIISF